MMIGVEEARALSLVPPAIWLKRLRSYQQVALLRWRSFRRMMRTSWLSEVFAWRWVQRKISDCFGSTAPHSLYWRTLNSPARTNWQPVGAYKITTQIRLTRLIERL
jgi:hypothetical protein